MRRAIDRWRNTDVNGNRLRLDSMTTKITKVASFQETIAKPSGAADLLRQIRGIQSDHHERAARALDEMETAVGDLLDQLHQDDFELLIELIFSSSGWKRISAVGGTQKTLDIAMVLPTTGEHCFVQVKSQTNRSTLRKLVEALDNSQGYSRMFFAYHTPAEAFDSDATDRVIVWHRYEIAKQAIRADLLTGFCCARREGNPNGGPRRRTDVYNWRFERYFMGLERMAGFHPKLSFAEAKLEFRTKIRALKRLRFLVQKSDAE